MWRRGEAVVKGIDRTGRQADDDALAGWWDECGGWPWPAWTWLD
jgi:hypothetical protein